MKSLQVLTKDPSRPNHIYIVNKDKLSIGAEQFAIEEKRERETNKQTKEKSDNEFDR